MIYLKQLSIIICISLVGEILARLIPIPMPASVYGIIILFVCLCTGIIKLKQIEKTADLLLMIMPVLFVPAGVGLITVWDKLSENLFEIMVITVVSTILVMAVTGLAAQAVIRRKSKGEKKSE